MSTADPELLKALLKENKALKQANETLRKAQSPVFSGAHTQYRWAH